MAWGRTREQEAQKEFISPKNIIFKPFFKRCKNPMCIKIIYRDMQSVGGYCDALCKKDGMSYAKKKSNKERKSRLT